MSDTVANVLAFLIPCLAFLALVIGSELDRLDRSRVRLELQGVRHRANATRASDSVYARACRDIAKVKGR